MGNFKKRGVVKFSNGKYKNKDGEERTSYVTAGDYFSSDGGNKQAIKLYATPFSEERWLNIYLDDDSGKTKFTQDTVVDEVPDEISLDDIPF